MEMDKKKNIIIYVLVGIIIILICVIGYFVGNKKLDNNTKESNSTATSSTKINNEKEILFPKEFEKLRGTWVNCDSGSTLVIIFKKENNKDYIIMANRDSDDSGSLGGIIINVKYENEIFNIEYLYSTEDGDETNEKRVKNINAININNNEINIGNLSYKKLSEEEAENYYCA